MALHNEYGAAKRCKKSVYTMRRWRVEGVGPPYFKIGRNVFYDDDDLEAFIKAQRVVPANVNAA